ncbi:MAG: DUF4340 domain-containing protein [Desulfomonile tiedjei]|nr:DUF4340 domain-containing protein [Desulfomonile tiedjei]
MKPSKILIYLVILVALGAYVYVVEIREKQKQEAIEEKSQKIVSLVTEKVVKVELISRDGGTIQIEKPANIWVMNDPVKTKADEPQVLGMLQSLAEAKSEKVVLEKDVKWLDYGLDKPAFSLVVSTEDQRADISFGALNAAKTSYYVRVDKEPRLLLVADTLKNSLNRSVFDLRDKSVFRVAEADVDRMVIQRQGAVTDFERKAPDKWVLTKPDSFAVKYQAARRNLKTLTALTAKEIIDEPQKEGDPYGLDNPGETIFLGGNKVQQTLLVGKAKTKGPESVSPDSDRYTRIKGQDTIYLVDGKVLNSLTLDPDKIRDRSVLDFNPTEINKAEIELDGRRLVALLGKDKTWTLEEPEKKDKIDAWAVTGILWDLKDLEWKSVTSPAPSDLATVFLDKPRLTISLFKKDDKHPMLLKAGWKTKPSEPEAAEMTSKPAGSEPQETAKPAAEVDRPPAPLETTPEPETVYAQAEPHELHGAVFTMDGKFLGRLRERLKALTAKK